MSSKSHSEVIAAELALVSQGALTLDHDSVRGRIVRATRKIPAFTLIANFPALVALPNGEYGKSDLAFYKLAAKLRPEHAWVHYLDTSARRKRFEVPADANPGTVLLAQKLRNNVMACSDGIAVALGYAMLEHSCTPNAFAMCGQEPTADGGVRNIIVLVSMRAIAAGEAVSVSYGSCEDVREYGIRCGCGSPGLTELDPRLRAELAKHVLYFGAPPDYVLDDGMFYFFPDTEWQAKRGGRKSKRGVRQRR